MRLSKQICAVSCTYKRRGFCHRRRLLCGISVATMAQSVYSRSSTRVKLEVKRLSSEVRRVRKNKGTSRLIDLCPGTVRGVLWCGWTVSRQL